MAKDKSKSKGICPRIFFYNKIPSSSDLKLLNNNIQKAEDKMKIKRKKKGKKTEDKKEKIFISKQ